MFVISIFVFFMPYYTNECYTQLNNIIFYIFITCTIFIILRDIFIYICLLLD